MQTKTPTKTKLPKRADQADQVRMLSEAIGADRIDPALPYMPQVFNVLKQAILAIRLIPGTPLSEAAIAEVFGLSRTPVREALRELSTEGLLDIFPQAGSVVSRISVRLIEQGAFVRGALETANLMDLVTRLDAAGRSRIEHVMGLQRQALAGKDYEGFYAQDEAMHKLFFELTDRLPVWHIVNQGKQHVDRARVLISRERKASSQRAFEDHLRIVDALFTQDKAVLAAALAEHFARVKESVLEFSHASHQQFFVE